MRSQTSAWHSRRAPSGKHGRHAGLRARLHRHRTPYVRLRGGIRPWEDKLTALAEAEAALEAVRQTRPPLPEPAALHALATDLPRLWNAPDTHDRDRKRLLRTLIADITVLPETDRRK